ncbi:uncharacterized protein LOC6533018 [Drosophila yakuba]|uniref:Uncharacterized protein n=1 Tax=Drosophila yakuba TaxID=7245 RepID=B4PIC3_DROYA|nr:uncharacterized protein LOC6533018 [Drosophila yakuba]EDW93465.1 uncharacterized protein Dyak_GE20582 [Drosophila yakuba]
MTEPISAAVQRRRQLLHSVESLRGRVRQVLKCVINQHIEFLVLESDVAALLDEVREFNDDHEEMRRLDRMIEALRDYSGPTICHEWPYPLIFKGTIDEAHVAQILNASELDLDAKLVKLSEGRNCIHVESDVVTAQRRSRLLWFSRRRRGKRAECLKDPNAVV